MGLIANMVQVLTLRNQSTIPSSVSSGMVGMTGQTGDYQQHARAYITNEIVAKAIGLLAESAGEPNIIGQRVRRARPSFASNVRLAGPMARVQRQNLITNGYVEELPNHPLVKLLNNPNPYMGRAEFMQFLVMDRYLAGDSYAAKLRGRLGNVVELWRLRPDRVRIIPDANSGVAAYEYKLGQNTILFPEEDVIHWRKPHPLNDYNGLSPLSPIMSRVQADAAMRDAISQFYLSGGSGPGAILTTTGKLTDEAKSEVRQGLRRLLNNPGSFRETLIMDQGTSTYQRWGLETGLTGFVPKDVNAIMESRIAMPFGIPGSILGLLIGVESSSYANKRADWQVFWDITLTPMLAAFDEGFTRSFCMPHGSEPPEFGGIDEVLFDLSDIRALQEDIDALHARARSNVDGGLWTIEEGRIATGMPDAPLDGDHLLLPTKSTIVPTPIEDVEQEHPVPVAPSPVPPALPPATPEENAATGMAAAMRSAFVVTVEKPKMLSAPRVGRRPLVEDPGAKALYDEGERIRGRYPNITLAQTAARLGIDERSYRRYRATFGE